MNRLILCALPLTLCSVAFAQPETPKPAAPAVPPALNYSTPVGTVRVFISDLQAPRADVGREWRITSAVYGARVGFYGSEVWGYALSNLAHFDDGVDSVRLASQQGDEATVTVISRFSERDPANFTTLRLRLDHNNIPAFGKNNWRILPPPIDEVLAKPFRETPLLLRAAALATRDPRLELFIQQERAESQLKQLDLGVSQFFLDYDETYAFDDAGHERALRPYLKDDTLYTIAGTKDEKWHFNDNLAGVSSVKIQLFERTVLFYDGTAPQSDKLNFRFGGKTMIGFADGHVAALSKDELKDLIWVP